MKLHLKPVIAGVAALALAGGALAVATTASAAPGPWQPDSNSNGRVIFYNAAGDVVTSGNDFSHLADYAVATTGPSPAAATKATLYIATPQFGVNPGVWNTSQSSTATTFPNATAPAPITGPGFTNPVVKLSALDGNLGDHIGSYPNSDTTHAGYIDVYQVRIVDSGPGVSPDGKYWESDIQVDTAAGTWQMIDPSFTTTSTSIAATPVSPQVTGASVTLNSAVSPAANGSVQFFDGATPVGTPQAVTTSAPNASVSAGTPAIGTHPYTAKFTPTGGTAVLGSTSSPLNYVITAPVITTNTALSVNPGTVAQYSSVTLTANITPADSLPAGQAGSVQFFNGASSLGVAATDNGTPGEYELTIPSVTLPASATPYQLHAVFTPSDSAYGSSTSTDVPLTVTAPSCPGTPVAGESCTDTQYIQATVVPGSLTITTPYGPSNPFVLPNLQLNSAGTQLSTSAAFPAAGDNPIVVTSSLAGNPNWTVSVTATDLTDGANSINGENLGLTGGSLDATPVFPGTVAFTNIPADFGTVAGGTGNGLKGGPHTFAQSSGGGNGSANMHGLLTLNAPTQTVAGTYDGTITFSVA